MKIIIDDLSGNGVVDLLKDHLNDMKAISPPESVHALDINALKKDDITFWSAWDNNTLLGCGAMKAISGLEGEIKSMRTDPAYRGKGVAGAILKHIISEAKERGYTQLSLETGTMTFFEPAHALYKKHGFVECGPFGSYGLDPYSKFMTLKLDATIEA